MDATTVNSLVSGLNYDWFKLKEAFFLKEGLYNKQFAKIYDVIPAVEFIQTEEDKKKKEEREMEEGRWEEEEREIVVDVDFNRYSWSSLFYGSDAARRFDSEEDYISEQFPVDSREIADDIVTFIYKKIEKFTDVAAIDTVIRTVVETMTKEVITLKQQVSNEEYSKALDYFVVNTRKEISNEFGHIKEQLNLIKPSGSVDRKLTPEICAKIANFRLGNKKFITTAEGGLDEGAALLHLLNPKSDKKTNIKIRTEDWKNNDVYYLLSRLADIITDRISFADIEKKKALLLKTGKFFIRSTFDSFKSQKLDAYAANPNKDIIDAQLASLFS